jgi:hypothetical protein
MANNEIIAIVAHDAGAGEILSSVARRMRGTYLLVLTGPALKIFERKLGPVNTTDLADAIERASWILCGTSWQSDLEWRATELARKAGKRCVAFLDHWVNYRQRFERDGEQRLPDELWVADQHAARLARENFPHVPIRMMGNPYFDDALLALKEVSERRLAEGSGETVLYICEPISEHALSQFGNERHMGYVEDEAVKYFFENMRLISSHINKIIMRPHPSEPQGKYLWAIDMSPVELQISTGDLISDLAQSDVIVGCESMAMIIALLANKRVICSIPPGGRPCALPYREIETISAMVESKAS